MTDRTRYSISVALLCVLLSGLLIVGVVPSEARPEPKPICEACGEEFVEAAASRNVPVTVERSTAVVRLHKNGSATWTVTNQIDASAADRLRRNDSLFSDITGYEVGDDLISANISEDDVVTIRYRTDEFAVGSFGGVMRSDEFTKHEYRNYDGLGADRLTLVAPENMRVGMAPADATVDGQQMILTSYDADKDDSFVTFVPNKTDGILATVLRWLSVSTALAPVYIPNIIIHVGLPAVVFALGIRLTAAVLVQFDREFARYAGLFLVIFSLIGVVSLLVVVGGVADALTSVHDSESADMLAVLIETAIGAGAFGAALSVRSVRDRLTYRTLTAGAVLAALIAGCVAGLLGESMINRTMFSVALFALVPAGYELGRGHRRRGYATAVIGYSALLVFVVPLGTRIFDFFVILSPTLGCIAALTAAVIGSPLLAVGLTVSTQCE